MIRVFFIAIIASMSGLLSGCMSSPTYGTDKSSSQQLFQDLTNMASLESQKGADIDYKSRPDLVRPPSTEILPEPQTSLVQNEEIWPQSPEEIRERLLAEAEANKDKPSYRSPLTIAGPDGKSLTAKEQRAAYRKARALQQGAYKERRYLSDPPAEYKVPASTAPIGELGETEKEKEKRRIAAATKKNTSKKWWQIWKK